MQRRRFLALSGSGALAGGFASAAPPEGAPARPFLLSNDGCGRATAYAEANRIVTRENRTHAAWLDSPPEGFRVRIRTLDRRTGEWSETRTIGEAHDNHGGPALTIDADGFLHVVYGPHHHPMRYRRSKRPNDASEWEAETIFGERLTYPTLVCGPDNTLYLTARRSHSDKPWDVDLWTLAPGGEWTRRGTILRSRHQGYAHFQESLAWGPDHRTLHLCCRFHEKSDREAYGRIQTVGHMMSEDLGTTWRTAQLERITMPATAETIDQIALGGADEERILRAGALAVHPRTGTPHVIYSATSAGRSIAILAIANDGGAWTKRSLAVTHPESEQGTNLIMPGGLSFDSSATLHGAMQVQTPQDKESTWGHPTDEPVRFTRSQETGAIEWERVCEPNPALPQWLPSIERNTGFNKIAGRPGLLFTAGERGKGNSDLLRNKVYWSA